MPSPRPATGTTPHSQPQRVARYPNLPRGRTAMYATLASVCALGIVSISIMGGVNVMIMDNNNNGGHHHVNVRGTTASPSSTILRGDDGISGNDIPAAVTPDTFQPEKATLEELHRRIRLDPIGGDVGWRGTGGECGGGSGDGGGVRGSASGSHHVRLLIGIPTVDNAGGAKRRDLQRDSWLKYPEVRNAAGPNHLCTTNPLSSSPYLGSVLVRFLLARHFEPNPTKPPTPSQQSLSSSSEVVVVKPYTFSPFSLFESSTFRDMLLFDLDEGKPSNPNKQAGGAGHWGLETEVGMSRKGMYWYLLALRHFSFDYVMKGDDDAFIRVPILIYDLINKVEPAAIAHRNQWLVNISGGGGGGGGDTTTTTAADAALAVVNGGDDVAEQNTQLHQHQKQRPYVYWGIVMKWGARKLTSSASHAKRYASTFTFVGGMSIIMSRAVVETSVVTDVELYRLSGPFRYFSPTPPSSSTPSSSIIIGAGGVKLYHHPISRLTIDTTTLLKLEASSKVVYKEHNLDHEDVMIGRSLYNLAMGYRGGGGTNTKDIGSGTSSANEDGNNTTKRGKRSPSLYTALGISVVADCRFHDVHAGANKRSGVSDTRSVVVHHVRPDEYQLLLKRFPSPLQIGGSGVGVDGPPNTTTSSSTIKEGSYIGHPIFNLC